MSEEAKAAVDAPHPRRRARASIALVVIGAVLLPIAGLSFWGRNQLLNTDRYVSTVKPLAADAAVQAAIVDRVTQAVTDAVDLGARAKDALPDKAKFLAAPIAAGAETLVRDLTTRFVASDQFQALWVEVNRIAHSQIVDVLEGKNTTTVGREDGKVIINLGPIAQQILNSLDAVVPVDLSSISVDKLNLKFTLVDSGDLAQVQTAVQWFNRATWLLVILALGCLVASPLVASDRRRGLQRTGVAVTISGAVTLLLYALVRDRYLANLPSTVQNPDAARAAFDIITRKVEEGLRAIVILGVIIFAGAWVAGPSRSAIWLRDRTTALAGRVGADEEPSPGHAWVAAHLTELRGGVVALAVIWLLLLDHPTAKAVLLLALVVVAGFGALRLIAGGRPKVEPSPVA